jgi:hypothetical protein
MKICKYHLCNKEFELKHKDSLFCSPSCKNKYFVDFQRKRMKVRMVLEKGGKCQNCGYNKCIWALEFHHRNKEEKSFSIGNPETRAWEKLKEELKKCDMLCANCHREQEFKEKSDSGKGNVYIDAQKYEEELFNKR